MANPTVIDILNTWLKNNHYDGLFNQDGECGCVLGDLAPCGELCGGYCEAGYQITNLEKSDYDFLITRDKPVKPTDDIPF